MRRAMLLVAALVLSAQVRAAEFLVIAKNNWMVDADTATLTQKQIDNRDRQYKIGDIVDVFPDGRLADTMRSNGLFYIVRVSGLSYDTAIKYMDSWGEDYVVNGSTCTRLLAKRKYRIRAQELPLSVRNTLKNTGIYNTTFSAVRTYIRNKITGINE